MAVTIVNHNIPLSFTDHLSPLFKECFLDSKIAQYSSARTKTSVRISRAVSPYLLKEFVDNMKKLPFCLSVDGSSDTNDILFIHSLSILGFCMD